MVATRNGPEMSKKKTWTFGFRVDNDVSCHKTDRPKKIQTKMLMADVASTDKSKVS